MEINDLDGQLTAGLVRTRPVTQGSPDSVLAQQQLKSSRGHVTDNQKAPRIVPGNTLQGDRLLEDQRESGIISIYMQMVKAEAWLSLPACFSCRRSGAERSPPLFVDALLRGEGICV